MPIPVPAVSPRAVECVPFVALLFIKDLILQTEPVHQLILLPVSGAVRGEDLGAGPDGSLRLETTCFGEFGVFQAVIPGPLHVPE